MTSARALRQLVEEARIEEVPKEAGRAGGTFPFEEIYEVIHYVRSAG